MLISIAVDFRRADVATREQFHLSEERLTQLYRTARTETIREAALIATCNRTELYAWVASDDLSEIDEAIQLLARRWMRTRTNGDALLRTATRRYGLEAARHVIRVASGLESQVLGDGQILGQLRSAYKRAARSGATGPVLHRLFETALRAGKRVQTETSLLSGRQSIGAEAASIAHQRFGTLQNARCLIVGCGKTGERTARQLVKLGARDLVLLNRTPEKAELLASAVGGRAAPMETLHVEAAMADVVIVATGSETPILQAEALRRTREACGTSAYALLLMDLSLPRNIDPGVLELAGVTLVDLDTLHTPIVAAEAMRRDAVPEAERVCDEETADFLEWVEAMPARDAIKPLCDALTAVARREVAFAAGEAVAERTAGRIVAKLLAGPMRALRKAVQRGEPLDTHTMLLFEMFTPARPAESRAAVRARARLTELSAPADLPRPTARATARPAERPAARFPTRSAEPSVVADR
jgi:glutamyl-tRNA reductase